MKSESFQKMMLRYMIVFGLVSLALAQSAANTNKSIKKPLETKYMKSASSIDLKKQQFQSTKERPELNPVLSALINEDIKKSIDAKRHAEYDLSPLSEPSKVAVELTTAAPVQTTVKYIPKALDDSVVVDSIAGSSSEKKQTSRIEVKKGPNGVDYEYEYVYYYYDDDDKDSSKKSTAVSDDKSIVSQNGGKNRYDKISTTPKPNFDRNELPTSRGKGRQSIPVVEETSEERLPVNTRFPPRSAVTPTVQVLSNVDETTKKISIKRPSLELVDSQSFNRGEKGQSKGSRVLENEFAKANDVKTNENPTIIPSVTELASQSAGLNDVTTVASDSEESTTQIMDKVALDLYAHLVNENSNIDLSTGVTLFEETSTSDSLSTSTEEFTTIEALTTTTTTSTTEAPTTTTTTTTTEAPALINGRRPAFGAGRRAPLKSRSKPTETKASVEEPPKESSSSETTSAQTKPKNRFSRPSFSARSRPTPTVAASTTSVEEEAVKQTTKPVAAAPAPRGRTRNRFNLRSSTTAPVVSEEKNPDENAIDTSTQITSTQRPLRTRPTFNLRGRSRAAPSSTAAPSAEGNTEPVIADAKLESEEKPSTAAPLKPSSRFNLRRPNQLLSPRGRVSPLAKTPAPSAEQSAETSSSSTESTVASTTAADLSKESPADAESEQIAAEPSTTPQTGLNRLRNRPRIQIQPKAPSANKQPTAASYINANRKVNPLISRRKIGSSTTTEETPATEINETSEEVKDPQSESKEPSSSENEGNAKEEAAPALVEASSEAPRGLGLLANRRRLAVRRPGTIL